MREGSAELGGVVAGYECQSLYEDIRGGSRVATVELGV